MPILRPVLAAALAALPLAPCAAQTAAGTIVGPASVHDGDRLDIQGHRIRLAGIDAPEPGQTCAEAGGRLYPCGRDAGTALAERIGGRAVTCTALPGERRVPAVAVCRVEGEDLGAFMVARGFAVADRLGPSPYGPEEEAARQAGRGLWRGRFTMPWDIRAGLRGPPDGYATTLGTPLPVPATAVAPAPAPVVAASAQSPQAGPAAACRIKGNITRDGSKLYWVPGSRRYAETVITEATGERWFCSEADARAAGWQEPEAPFGPRPVQATP